MTPENTNKFISKSEKAWNNGTKYVSYGFPSCRTILQPVER